jgi:hypothetical protein
LRQIDQPEQTHSAEAHHRKIQEETLSIRRRERIGLIRVADIHRGKHDSETLGTPILEVVDGWIAMKSSPPPRKGLLTLSLSSNPVQY